MKDKKQNKPKSLTNIVVEIFLAGHLNIRAVCCFRFHVFTGSSVCPSFYLVNMAAVAVVPLLFNVNDRVPVEVDFMTVGL